MAELEKQVGPLARQSEAAREYLRLKERLKLYDANLFLTESETLKGQLTEIEGREVVVTGDLETVRTESERLKTEYDELSQELEGLENLIQEERDAMSRAVLMKESLEGQINVLGEQINTERMNEEHIKSRISSIENEIAARTSRKEEYEKEREELSRSIREVAGELSCAEKELAEKEQEILDFETLTEDAKAEIIRALNEKAGLAARQQRYATMLEQVDVRRAEVSQKLLKFKSDESIQDEQIKEEEIRLHEIEEHLTELAGRENALVSEAEGADEEVKRLGKRLNFTQQEYHKSYTKLESLKNLAERYDGYGNSIRRVMEVRDRVVGIHGVVADIISTTKEYETAIETALGGSIQNIVTDSEQTAKQLIEYLKKNKYGRATFLPLTSVADRGSFNQESALREPGVLGLASDLVTVDKQYRGLAGYLLGRVIVADHIEERHCTGEKI